MLALAFGGYERVAHAALVAQGVRATIVNPNRVRDFARGMGLEAKTGRVDARVIARYGEVTRPAATLPPDHGAQLMDGERENARHAAEIGEMSALA